MNRETKERLLEGFKHLRAFKSLQAYARDRFGRSGTSYAEVKELLLEHEGDDGWREVRRLLQDVRLHGKNHIYLYRINDVFYEQLLALEPSTESPLAITFPDVDSSALPGESDGLSRPTLIHRINDSDDVKLVYGSVRTAHVDELLDLEWLTKDAPDEVAERLADASEVIVRKTRRVVAYDVVVLPRDRSRPVQVWVDYFSFKTEPSPDESLNAVKFAAREGAPGAATTPSPWDGAVNVGVVMDDLYAAEDEGRIVELAFQCPTQARRREVAQHKTDLRTELYHIGGIEGLRGESDVEATGLLDIYRLGIQWDHDDNGEPLIDCRLLFPGTVRLIGKSKDIYELRATHRMSRTAHEFAMSRIEQYVTP